MVQTCSRERWILLEVLFYSGHSSTTTTSTTLIGPLIVRMRNSSCSSPWMGSLMRTSSFRSSTDQSTSRFVNLRRLYSQLCTTRARLLSSKSLQSILARTATSCTKRPFGKKFSVLICGPKTGRQRSRILLVGNVSSDHWVAMLVFRALERIRAGWAVIWLCP